MNRLYYGDNLDVMRQHLPDESVDLVYLDPPFNSGRNYNAIFKAGGKAGTAQIKAFTDTWTWDKAAAVALDNILKAGGALAHAMEAFSALLGQGSTLAYLSMMAPRLQEIRRVMKDTASVYLHCDPSASHYLKILMDAIFGKKNFRNEVVWCYDTAGRTKRQWNQKHDLLLFYSRSKKWGFNETRVERRNRTEGWERWYPHQDDDGRYYQFDGKGYKYYADAGKLANDWWDDLPALHAHRNPERLGYPTQKPLVLLDRIIKASSNPGDVVLDPFCGCGTAVDAAQGLDRKWIGIDITHLAIGVMRKRLNDKYGADCKFKVIGEPKDLAGAKQLASDDTHQFEHWALGLVGARASAKGKGGDKGIDGILLMDPEEGCKVSRQVPISVKSGNVNVGMIRDLRGVMTRDSSPIGILVTLKPPTKGMKAEALAAGFYEASGLEGLFGDHIPCIQILSVENLLAGTAKAQIPALAMNQTHKRARK